MSEQPEHRTGARLAATLAISLVAAACLWLVALAFNAAPNAGTMPSHRVASHSPDVADDTASGAGMPRIAIEPDGTQPSGASPTDDATLFAEYRDIPTLGELSPDQVTHARGILSNLYKMRASAMEQLPSNDQGHLDGDVARARMLRKVEVSLAAIDALEHRLYIVIPRDSPPPPLIPGTERVMFGSGGRNHGQQSNIVLFMPHSRYPGLAAVGEYEKDLVREQRRGRIHTFNLRPVAERRALRAQFLRRDELSDEERTRVLDAMPIGTEWNEPAAMISEPRTGAR